MRNRKIKAEMYELRKAKISTEKAISNELKMVPIDLQEVIKIGILTGRSPIKDGKPRI
jgi:hypothetical protein